MTRDLEFEKMFPVPDGVVLMRNNFYASPDGNLIAHIEEIGRASCRERV